MKRIALLTGMILCVSLLIAQDQTTFILVRHAEKADDGTRNPPLNEAGIERANKLVDLLNSQTIDALYSTPFKRTLETLTPLARERSLSIGEYKPMAGEEWLKELYEKHRGETIVIAGHSNTIPGLTNLLTGRELSQFDESDYKNVMVVVGNEIRKGKLIWLNF